MKRLWGIRHIRWFWHSYWFWRWWDQVGCHAGAFPNTADTDHLIRIRRGEA